MNPPPANSESERKSIRELKRRNSDAMLSIYDLYGALMYSVIFRAVQDRASAENLLHETMFRVWNRVYAFDEEAGNLSGWLVTLARNRAFEHLRSLRNGAPRVDPSGERCSNRFCLNTLASASPSPDRSVSRRLVVGALARLDAAQRRILDLIHFEGMNRTEAAGHLDLPLPTVQELARTAFASLRPAPDDPENEKTICVRTRSV